MLAHSSGYTELLGVLAIKDACKHYPNLDTRYLREGDCYPHYDGEILVYNKDGWSGKDIAGRVPVQIKGQMVDEFSHGQVPYQVNTASLQQYMNERGVVFFCVEIAKESTATKIFYSLIHQFDARQLLQGIKEDQQTRTVHLTELPTESKNNIYLILKYFLIHSGMSSISESITTIEKRGIMEKYPLQLSFPSEMVQSPADIPIVDDLYIYVDTPFGSSILEHVKAVETVQRLPFTISIGEQEVYSGYDCVHTREGTVLKFSEGITCTIRDSKFSITYNCRGVINDVIKDAVFMTGVCRGERLSIGECSIGCFEEAHQESNDVAEKFQKLRMYWARTIRLLDHWGVNMEVRIEDIDDNERKVLAYLYAYVFEGKTALYDFAECTPHDVKVAGRKILLFFYKGKMQSLFSRDFSTKVIMSLTADADAIQRYAVSPYINMEASDFANCINLDTDVVWETIVQHSLAEHSVGVYNNLLLNLIRAYDTTHDTRILNLADKLANYLYEYESDDIQMLNHFQVKKRKGPLSTNDLASLHSLQEKRPSPMIACGAALLLDDNKSYEESFGMLTQEEQEQFESYPIAFLKRNLSHDG